MNDPARWNRATFDEVLADRKTRTIYLDKPRVVYLIYWTAMAPSDGTVHFFEDVYDRDKVVLKELRSAPKIDIPTVATRYPDYFASLQLAFTEKKTRSLLSYLPANPIASIRPFP